MKFAAPYLTILLYFLLASKALARSEPWERLKEHFRTRQIRSGQEFTAALPVEFRRNFFLNFGTDSPQVATPLLPRAVLMSDDAKIVVAIEGGLHDQPEPLLVEAISFDESRPGKPLFRPHLIQIRPEEGQVLFIDDPGTIFPRGNSRHCAGCHGSGDDFRLIWDSYPTWRHTYGSGFRLRPSRVTDYPREISLLEQKNWLAFQGSHSHRGIYQYLQGARTLTISLLEDKNADVTALFNRLNFARIFGQIGENPAVQRRAPEILAILTASQSRIMSLTFSPSLQTEIQAAIEQHEAHVSKALERLSQARASAFDRSLGEDAIQHHDFDRSQIRRYALLRFFMQRAGLSMRHWPMTLEADSFSFADPIKPFNTLIPLFWERVFVPTYPDAAKLLEIKTQGHYLDPQQIQEKLRTQYSLKTRLPHLGSATPLLALRRLPGLASNGDCAVRLTQ